jgi:hypothetical protein
MNSHNPPTPPEPSDEASKMWKKHELRENQKAKRKAFLTWPWVIAAGAIGILVLFIGLWIVAFD